MVALRPSLRRDAGSATPPDEGHFANILPGYRPATHGSGRVALMRGVFRGISVVQRAGWCRAPGIHS